MSRRIPFVVAGCVVALSAPEAALAQAPVLSPGVPWLSPPADGVVAEVAHVDRLHALRGRMLFRRRTGRRGARWGRVVRGRILPVRGMPRRAEPSTMGLDAAGRVVVTVTRHGRRQRWWTYQVARDVARPVRLDTRRRCSVGNVASWRGRLAYSESCSRRDEGGGRVVRRERVLLRGRSETRTLYDEPHPVDALALRGRSLAALLDKDEHYELRWLQDRGRACTGLLSVGDPEYETVAPIDVSGGTMRWGASDIDLPPDPLPFLRVTEVASSAPCTAGRPRGLLAVSPPDLVVRAAAIDRRTLYYADGTAIRRRALPAAGSVAPPVNDAFADAIPLTGEPPLSAAGVTEHATREPGEPPPAADPGFPETGTVWYRWRSSLTGAVDIPWRAWSGVDLYEGAVLEALTPVPFQQVPVGAGYVRRYAVDAGTEYRLGVRSTSDVPYRPFDLGILPATP